jgi:diguanylate cyclase (GGDEF)-like protein
MSRRAAVNQRLQAGFLAGLPVVLHELASLLDLEGEEGRDPVAFELERIGSTAGSLGLDTLGKAAEMASLALAKDAHPRILKLLVRAVRAQLGSNFLAPVAVIGDPRTISSIEAQDDGCCEPVLGFDAPNTLRNVLAVDWPQAIVLPATQAHEVEGLAKDFDCPVFLYGASRDAGGRLAAARVGAAGFFAEPLALSEMLAQIRFHAWVRDAPGSILLVGPEDWGAEVAAAFDALDPHRSIERIEQTSGIPAVLHGTYPAAVVLGPIDPTEQAEAIRMMRQHVGRTHIALAAVGDPALYAEGVDDVLAPLDNVAERVMARLERLADFRRDTDDLTQIPNRSGGLEFVQRYASWSERGGQPLSIALVRVEGLTSASKQHGREAGNACRRHLAAALERGLRRVDLVAAIGSDLYVAALVECERSEAQRRMHQIKTGFETRVQADRRLRDVSLSIGLADSLGGTRGLMKRAQDALDSVRSAAR